MRVMLASEEPFALAGLWDAWQTPEGEWLNTCTIVTTESNALVAPFHDRMAAILPPEREADWLSRDHDDITFLQSLLRPFPAERMKCYPVSSRVNNVKNDDPTLIEPAAV